MIIKHTSSGLDHPQYEIKDVYKVGERSTEVEMAAYAKWTPSGGIHILDNSIWKRRSNLRGYQIR